MSDQEKPTLRPVSRRGFLNVAAVGSGTLITIGLAGRAFAAPKKFSQQQAHYQPIPKSGQRCQACALWQSPTSCQVVDGQVSPAGWCMLYQAKG
jgi:hypothetical protein